MAPGCASNRDDDTTVMGYSPLVPNSRRCAVLGPAGLGKIRSKLKMTVDDSTNTSSSPGTRSAPLSLLNPAYTLS